MPTREDTKVVMNSLNERPANANVFGNGPLVVSDIPKSCQKDPVIVGVDEAGRGCVLGPMVYGAAYWSADHATNIPKGFNDSKQLSDETRRRLYKQILDHDDIGFVMRAFLPGEISRNMLRSEPYNLNQMSHDATFCMIRKLLDGGLNIQTCFIDTVGIAEHYQRKLEREFPGVQFVVESKADAKYAPCSAASVGTYTTHYCTCMEHTT
jgi:ribonuclease H2 subunit A